MIKGQKNHTLNRIQTIKNLEEMKTDLVFNKYRKAVEEENKYLIEKLECWIKTLNSAIVNLQIPKE